MLGTLGTNINMWWFVILRISKIVTAVDGREFRCNLLIFNEGENISNIKANIEAITKSHVNY